MDNMINLDSTLFIQLVNFLVTIVVLNFLLIKPIRQQISARGALTQNLAAEIETFSSEASEKLSSYEASLSNARSKAAQARDAIKAQGSAKEQELLQKAQADALSFIQASKADTAKQAKAATDTLLSQVDTFASKAMKKILG